MLVLFPLGFLLFFGLALDHKFNTLSYYHPSEILLDSTSNELGKSYMIPDFSFQNYNGETISREMLSDDVYLLAPYSLNSEYVSVITKRLLTANFKYREEDNIKIIGLNSDGIVQSKGQLEEYMSNLFINTDESENYFYLSSNSKLEMQDFIQKGLGIRNLDNSAVIVLIDTESKIRGRYNLNAERQINDAMDDIALLRKEIDIAKYEAEKSDSGN